MRSSLAALTLLVTSVTVSLYGASGSSEGTVGALYVASNAPAGNDVLVFDRDEAGSLSFAAAIATGGTGTGGGLGNQSGLVLSPDGRWLLVVNAGSHDVSVFQVSGTELTLTDRAPSGGQQPVSVAIDRDLVYVLNAGGAAGGADSIAGFRLDRSGRLQAIAGSIQPLSAPNTAPAQIGFTPDGRQLVVTEKATNLIGIFSVVGDDGENDGVARPGTFHPSAGITPFGFAFDRRGRLLNVEAGSGPDASTVSSYAVTEEGALEVVSPSVPTTESATCWVVVTDDGRFAFTTNTGSGTVSALSVDRTGALALRDADGVAATTGAGSAPADAALSTGGRFLYTRNGGTGTISAFRVTTGGDLVPLSTLEGLPAGANGLAAR